MWNVTVLASYLKPVSFRRKHSCRKWPNFTEHSISCGSTVSPSLSGVCRTLSSSMSISQEQVRFSSTVSMKIPSVAELIIAFFTGTCLFFIYQWYESPHIELKLFLGEIGTVFKLDYELPNHYIRLACTKHRCNHGLWGTGIHIFFTYKVWKEWTLEILVEQVQILKNLSSGIIVETHWEKRPANCYRCHS